MTNKTEIDFITRKVNNHLGDYAIKGILVREDVKQLVIEARLLQSEVERLQSQVQGLKTLLKVCLFVRVNKESVADMKQMIEAKLNKYAE